MKPTILRTLLLAAGRCTLGLALEEGSAGNGLAGMRERAAALGGKLLLSLDPGLRLELRVPAGGLS